MRASAIRGTGALLPEARLRRAPVPLIVLLGAVAVIATEPPARTSGLDLSALDTSVRPQDDLYRFANGGWLARTAIPPDRVYCDAFTQLTDKVEVDLRAIIEPIAADTRHRRGSAQRIGDLYASLTDQARVEALGAAPIERELQAIDAIGTTGELATQAGYLSAIAAGGPFIGIVEADANDSRVPIVRLNQGGTLLPDRDYYLKDDATFVESRAKYDAYLVQVFTLTRRANPAADARAVLALETALARVQWTQVDSRDAGKINNKFALERLPIDMPGFDWLAWAKPQGIDHTPNVVLSQPSFFRSFAAMVPTTPLETWKAWLVARYVTASAPFLSAAFADARFEFFGRVLSGQQLPRARWKRGVGLVNTYLGDAVGRLYVDAHFPASARARVQQLVTNVLEAYRRAIGEADWMDAATRRQALDKLSKLTAKIGYPDEWRDYGGLVVKADDLLGNVQRAQKFEAAYQMARNRQPRDRGDWLMTPQTVNAYYSPAMNEIVLPAALLQPPLFNPEADDAVNYGGIGAFIGHEIGHGFDENGGRVDGNGAIRDWWKPEDVQKFRIRAQALVDQFDAYSPMEGMHVNGALTLRENVGDLGGLSIAYRAYLLSLGDRPAPVIDGFSGTQRLFIGWAQIWRFKVRDEFLRQWLLSIAYAPPRYRANGVVGNVPGFYEAFGLQPGDTLYRAPEKRVRIW